MKRRKEKEIEQRTRSIFFILKAYYLCPKYIPEYQNAKVRKRTKMNDAYIIAEEE